MVPQDHFFRKLNEMVDWGPLTKKLSFTEVKDEPALLLKMLLLSCLYNLSERQTEELCNDSPSPAG